MGSRVTGVVIVLVTLSIAACSKRSVAPPEPSSPTEASVVMDAAIEMPAVDASIAADGRKSIDAAAAIAGPAPAPDAGASRDDILALSRYGFLSVEASASSKIYIDGKLLGETPVVRLPLVPGKHALKVIGPGGKTKELEIEIVGGKDVEQKIVW